MSRALVLRGSRCAARPHRFGTRGGAVGLGVAVLRGLSDPAAPNTGRRGACGFEFVRLGSVTATSPRVVSANRYCWLLTASNDTRTGPMIGSRIGMRACTLKKYVSNATIVVSGDAANTIRLLMLPEPPPQLGLHGPPGSKVWLSFMSIPGVACPIAVVPH